MSLRTWLFLAGCLCMLAAFGFVIWDLFFATHQPEEDPTNQEDDKG